MLNRLLSLLLVVLSLSFGVYAQSGIHATSAAEKVVPLAENELDLDARDFNLEELEKRLSSVPVGPERDYFSGIIANRAGRYEESIRLLNKALPQIPSNRPYRLKEAFYSLIYDYSNLYRYADAFRIYRELAKGFPGTEKDDDYSLLKVLQSVPPQTISWDGPTRLKTEHSPLGSIDAELTVNGIKGPWLLDTGANHSVVSVSFAKLLGLQPILGETHDQGGAAGVEIRIRVGVLPVLSVGGATLHNVVLEIMDDEALRMPLFDSQTGAQNGQYQIQAILGFPVLQALGAVTFTRDGELQAGSIVRQKPPVARIFMNRLEPLIECGVGGRKVLFSFDTGASTTGLSDRFFRDFSSQFQNLKKGEGISAGAGGTAQREVYILPEITLKVASTDATLRHVTVNPTPIGTDMDENYGNIGRDLTSGFDSFTLDFSNMTFSLGRPVSPRLQ